MILVPTVFYAEKMLIDSIVHYSSSEERQKATVVSYFSHSLRADSDFVKISDTPIGGGMSETPEGKAYLGLSNAMFVYVPDFEAKILPVLPAILE